MTGGKTAPVAKLGSCSRPGSNPAQHRLRLLCWSVPDRRRISSAHAHRTERFQAVGAAAVGAFAVFCNAAGNVLSGWLHDRGVRSTALILTGCAAMAIGGSIVLLDNVSGLLRTVSAGGLFIFTGLIPSSLFALIPDHAPDRSVIATVSGIVMQGAAIGQLVGPPIGAAIVASSGVWQSAIPVVLVCAAISASCTLLLRRTGPRGQAG